MQPTLAQCLGRLALWLRFILWLTAPAHLMVALDGPERKLVDFAPRITVTGLALEETAV